MPALPGSGLCLGFSGEEEGPGHGQPPALSPQGERRSLGAQECFGKLSGASVGEGAQGSFPKGGFASGPLGDYGLDGGASGAGEEVLAGSSTGCHLKDFPALCPLKLEPPRPVSSCLG